MLTSEKNSESDRKQFAFACVLATIAAALAALVSAEAAAQVLSAKRGFADTGASFNYLQATNSGWYYRWGPTKANIGNFDAKFVPMFWNGGQANQSNINTIINYGDVEWVLGFNEPERPDQANMTVGQAISAWQTLSSGFAGTGIKLISPGVADTGGADGGQAWLSSFMSQASAQGLQVDAVAFHWYGASTPDNPIGAANSFISRVDSYHSQYNRPVWITEFAIHDWGGNYTDEEMRNANAIFLDNVIPRLESRSYVAGYAWYNWFGDSALVEGNPLTPTNVGVPYVGTITSGNVFDFSGVDLGQHVAYLAGGELTHGNGPPGLLRYINALSGISTISGTTDWGLTRTNWVRVQPGATLRKTGSNRITWNAILLANNGTVEVAEGELHLMNNPTITGSGKLLVHGGGTLGLSGVVNPTIDYHVELDGGTVAAPSDVGVVAMPGAVLSGDGVVSGGLVADSGSTIRVGQTGLSTPSWTSVDDFESYAPGKLNAGATGEVWTGVFDGTANAQVVDGFRNRSLEFYGTGSSWRGARTSLRTSFSPDDYSLADGEKATYFFRVQRQGSQTIDGIFGLTNLESIGITVPWSELATTLSLFQGTGPGDTTALRAYDSDSGVDVIVRNNIGADEWINVWLVVDNENKTFQVATSTGTEDGILFPNTFNFSRQMAIGAALETFAGAEFRSGSNPSNASVRIDDLVYLTGENLTNPIGGLEPGIVLDPATLTVVGNLTLDPGAILELDIYDTQNVDVLAVTGNLGAGGTLNVALEAGAPEPSLGDQFNIFGFGSASGMFAAMNLPNLLPGLGWNSESLYTDGSLIVVSALAGDYNGDGVVNAGDYTVWRDNLGDPTEVGINNNGDGLNGVDAADYALWVQHFGDTLPAGGGSGAAAATAVPEPSGRTLAVLAVLMLGIACQRRQAAEPPGELPCGVAEVASHDPRTQYPR